MNKYTIYIPSKGRHDSVTTFDLLRESGLDSYIVVEPQDYDDYHQVYGDRVIMLDENNMGISYSRNYIKQYSKNKGEDFHWQMDDDITKFNYVNKGKRTKETAFKVITTTEEFVDRYENIGGASIAIDTFVFAKNKPFDLNCMIYGVMLLNSNTPFEFRGVGEDTDMSIQILEAGMNTITMNVFSFNTKPLGKNKGGNYDWYMNDGKLERLNTLISRYPHLPIKIKYNKEGEPNFDTKLVWRLFTHGLTKK